MTNPARQVVNPVALKDLRVRMRERDSLVAITCYLAIPGAIVVGFLIWHSVAGSDQPSEAGVRLFQVFAITQLLLILVLTPASTAASVSGERYHQTWELLLLTRLSAFDIVWGKLLASLAFNSLLLVASLPLLTAVFLFGGVSPGDMLHAYLVLVSTVALLGAVSLFVSVLSYRPTVSAIGSIVLSLLLGVGLSVFLVYVDANAQGTSLTDLNQLSSLSSQAPQVTPLMHVDPLIVLLSVLPDSGGSTMLGGMSPISHTFGLPLDLALWQAFALLTLVSVVLLLALSSLLARPRFLRLRQA